jgi:hypothetical protein
MNYLFPTSGVETNILIPPLVAFAISFFTSMGGVSGAFLILPFQMSVLDYTTPSVSATNFVYNIVAIPSGVYRYIREGRMVWPLTLVVIAGTLPGVFIGYYMRLKFFPDPRTFKMFVAAVLLYLGGRLLYSATGLAKSVPGKRSRLPVSGSSVRTVAFGWARVEYEFMDEIFSFSTPGMFLLAAVVGIIGGIYGIGGGAIIAPFCVAIFRLPVYTVAGAALMGTFLTSVAGVTFYSLIPAAENVNKAPDWRLGILFGIGGFAGMYMGARFQKHVPQRLLKLLLAALILFVAVTYIVQYFLD